MPGTAVTIGAYDGVHLGHRALLRDLCERARADGLSTVVVTFDRHPASVVRPDSAPRQLTDLDQKLDLLAACGIDRTLVVPFDRDRADETAEDFVKEVLVDTLEARLVVVGEDFHFGHGRKGNVALLTELGQGYGFEVVGVGLTGDEQRTMPCPVPGSAPWWPPATSKRRPSCWGGRTRSGARWSTAMDAAVLSWAFPPPTCRSPTRSPCRPTASTPAVSPGRTGPSHLAAISVGRRPTFYAPGETSVLVEAYLLHFEGDLYGELGRVAFVGRLRDELKFDSVDALIAQMGQDVADAEALLGADPS